ncbi:MAG TPA: PilZ domain-containing protein [Thermodesulfobacteriota bacterium]|nr:PilZ domain-containing protein [Thermodesulfobacteriota bacterium]
MELRANRAENSLFEIRYYRKTVKVTTFSILVITFSLIILLARLISFLLVVLEHVFQLLKRIRLIETEEKKTRPHSGIVDFQRRRYPRFDVDLPLEYNEVNSSITRHARALNLSEGGMLIHSADQLEIGRQMKSRLSFPLGSEMNTVEMQGELVWAKTSLNGAGRDYRSGVRFLGALPKDKAKLTHLLISLSE